MEDRNTIIRDYILKQLENGELKKGDKLPGAREIASKFGYSLITVQNTIDSLAKEGVVITISRRGTFVHNDWKTRVLQSNITLFRNNLPWEGYFSDQIRKVHPQLRVTSAFNGSIFEFRTTQYVQAHHNLYMDLSELFNECLPDQSDIINLPFKSFYVGNKLVGLPIIYSPRVLFYNPKLLKEAGCLEPYAGWSWEEFIECIHKLKEILPGEDVFFWEASSFLWMNFVVRSGGSLIDFTSEDPVAIDKAETRRGLKLFRELRHKLNIKEDDHQRFNKKFLEGKAAMSIDAREFAAYIKQSGFKDWRTVPLPRIPGGKDLNIQATDLFCVRKSCIDIDAVKDIIKLIFSESFQNYLAELSYGIPVRKSAAAKTIDYESPSDMLFLAESAKMYSTYNLDSIELYDLVNESVRNLMLGNEDIDNATTELASLVRTYIKLKRQLRKTA